MADPDCPPDDAPTTLCDRDKVNNVWVEGHDPEKGVPGICLLDTIPLASVTDILRHDEVARRDLKRVTSNAVLLALADNVKRLPTGEAADKFQRTIGQTASAGPFYDQFHGKWPQGNR